MLVIFVVQQISLMYGLMDQFDVWINAGGKRMQGLVNRRAKEKLLFLK